MFDLGMQELIVIFIVALLVFGPKKLPELSKALGKGIRELKTALRGVKESIDEAETSVSEEIKGVETSIADSINKEVQPETKSEEGKEEKTEKNKDG
ncbi:MAG: twin-arginine translocase TatA/TatE family subunit [Thermodesulfovibrionia bacterium]|nr:twin-arginine translocase TatA/TatE family subunit [Thermodesulfovibrionia bacterium]